MTRDLCKMYSVRTNRGQDTTIWAHNLVVREGADGLSRAYFYIEDSIAGYFLEPLEIIHELDESELAELLGDPEAEEDSEEE